MFDELFALGGRDREDYFELLPVDPFYRIFDENGRSYTYHRDLEKAKQEVAKISPDDVDGFERFTKNSVKIFEKYHPLTEKPFLKLKEMLDIIPDSFKMRTFLPTYHYASRFVKDPFLRRICSFHPLLIGGSPFDTPAIFDLIIQFEKEWGIHYARGGTGAIVNALGNLFQELGGHIEVNTEVSEIVLKDGKATGVRLADGRVHQAEEVVCNGDVAFAYKHLIPKQHRPAKIDLYIDNLAYSNSLVVIYFGTKRRYLDSQLSHHNIIFNKGYRKLLRRIFKGKPLSDELCMYLHMPTITDESIAPEGCESFYVLSLVPHLDANVDWNTIGPEYNDKILGFLEENYLPDLRENIIAQSFWP
jgi:phytoene desaturase